MKRAILALTALLFVTGSVWAQGRATGLGELARKLRTARAKKDLSKVPLYTNDNLPKSSIPLTIMGRRPAPAGEGAPSEGQAKGQAEAAGEKEEEECDEQCWRAKFSEQRRKIRTAEGELDILQREYNLSRTQHYQDPNAALREQYSNTVAGGRELQNLLNRIEEKKRDIEKFKQEMSAMEREMRRSGGQPGWARE